MLKTTLAGLLAHKLRLSLTAFAIVLGVAFVAATLILSNGLQATFDGIITTQDTKVAVVVHGHVEPGGENGGFGDPHHPLPDTLLATVKSVSGVKAAEGIVFRAGASPLDPSGQPYPSAGPPEFATNWISSPDLSPYHLRSGTPPTGAQDVVIDAGTARAHSITVGQHLFYVVNGGAKQEFVVSGIAGYGTSDTLAGATISLFRLDTAQHLLKLDGKLDQIDVAAADGVSDSDLRARIAAAVPGYAEAVTGVDATGQQVKGIDSFFSILRTILVVFALVALFVGTFIIFNTFNILIAQRTRELALLRALGASRAQVFQSVLVEACIVGILASAAGCLFGLLLAHGLYSAVSTAGNGLPPATLALDWGTVALGMILGVGVTVAASIFPARRASRVSPVEAIREATDSTTPLGVRRIGGSIAVTLLGVALVCGGLFSGASAALQLFGVGAFVLFIGVSLLAPLAVVPICGTLGIPIERMRGAPGKLARLNATRSPRRAAATAAALMIGVTLIVAIAVLSDSLKTSTNAALTDAFRADYLVLSAGGGGGSGQIDPTTTVALSQDPYFTAVQDVRVGTVQVNGATTTMLGLNPDAYSQVLALDAISGDPTTLGQGQAIFVDQKQAADNNWKVGDQVQVYFPQAETTVPLRIACIYNSNGLVQGYVIATSTYSRYFTEQKAVAILVKARSGVSHSTGLARLAQDLKQFPTLKAFDSASFLALQQQQIATFALIIDIFLLMAIVIAALGIVNTLALSIIERTREIGLLRAIGLERRQTRTMVRWESVLIAFLGLVLGIALGLIMGVAVVRALASFGLSHTTVPLGPLAFYAVGAFLIGLAAAILPARRAARLNILDAIASE